MVMAVSMRNIMDQHEKDKVRNDDPLEFIPKEYRDFADVFSTTEADTLAPHRGSVDYHIVHKAGMKPDWAPVRGVCPRRDIVVTVPLMKL